MTPIDTAIDKADKQTSICWKRRESRDDTCFRGSTLSLASVATRGSTSQTGQKARVYVKEWSLTFNFLIASFYNSNVNHFLIKK